MPYTNDFFRRAGACSRRHFIRTAEDESPYSEKTSVYFLSYQKSVAGATQQNFAPTLKRCGRDAAKFHTNFKALRARRVKQTVRWTVCSQSGEQFIIATWGFKPGTQPQVSRCLFASFSALEKEDNVHKTDPFPYN